MPLPPGESGRWKSTVAIAAVASAACSLSAGAILARPSAGGAPSAPGPSLEASLQLPRSYRSVAGIEWSRAGTPTELWRMGALFGYGGPLGADGRLTWQGTARAGFARCWSGSATGAGAFGGARLGALIRIGDRPEPWEGDSLLDSAAFLVFDAGADGLATGNGLQPELSARVLLRFHFTSSLLP